MGPFAGDVGARGLFSTCRGGEFENLLHEAAAQRHGQPDRPCYEVGVAGAAANLGWTAGVDRTVIDSFVDT
jgi:hypothetical protein